MADTLELAVRLAVAGDVHAERSAIRADNSIGGHGRTSGTGLMEARGISGRDRRRSRRRRARASEKGKASKRRAALAAERLGRQRSQFVIAIGLAERRVGDALALQQRADAAQRRFVRNRA